MSLETMLMIAAVLSVGFAVYAIACCVFAPGKDYEDLW